MAQELQRHFWLDGAELPWAQYFQKMEMLKSMGHGYDKCMLTFYGMKQDELAKYALNTGSSFQLQWGSTGAMSAKHDYVMLTPDVEYVGDYATVHIYLIDHRVHLQSNSAFVSYANKTVSQIMQTVIGSYSHLPAAVIRDTKINQQYIQTGQTHWNFFENLHNDISLSTDKIVGAYRMFFKNGNEFHYHPPDYSASPYRVLNLAGGSTSPITRLRINPWKPIVAGGDNYKVTTWLRDEKRPYTSSGSSDSAFSGQELSGKGRAAAVAKPSNQKGSFLGKFLMSVKDRAEYVDNKATHLVNKAHQSMTELEVFLEGDSGVEPGHIIAVHYPDRLGNNQTEATGTWLVEEVHHVIEGMHLGETKIKMSRSANTTLTGRQFSGVKINSDMTQGTGQLSQWDGGVSLNFGSMGSTTISSSGVV